MLNLKGASFDDLGRGQDEGVSNLKELSENGTSKSLEVLKQISSTGYLRKRLPQELVVLQGGQTNLALDNSNLELDIEVNTIVRAPDERRLQLMLAQKQRCRVMRVILAAIVEIIR